MMKNVIGWEHTPEATKVEVEDRLVLSLSIKILMYNTMGREQKMNLNGRQLRNGSERSKPRRKNDHKSFVSCNHLLSTLFVILPYKHK